MSPAPWLEVGDQFILDDADYLVSRVLIARTDRLSFQLVDVRPSLGGETRQLLLIERRVYAVEPIDFEALQGEEVSVGGRTLRLRWESELRTELADMRGTYGFALGRCAYYEGKDGSIGVRVEEAVDSWYAIVGAPLDPSRIDLRFT